MESSFDALLLPETAAALSSAFGTELPASERVTLEAVRQFVTEQVTALLDDLLTGLLDAGLLEAAGNGGRMLARLHALAKGGRVEADGGAEAEKPVSRTRSEVGIPVALKRSRPSAIMASNCWSRRRSRASAVFKAVRPRLWV